MYFSIIFLHHSLSSPTKSKWHRDVILPQAEWLSSRIQAMTNVNEDVEKKEPSMLLVGMQISAATMEISMEALQKTKNKTTI
jgi:hypothetical protein